jgi:adenine specific DNA methylase Mod
VATKLSGRPREKVFLLELQSGVLGFPSVIDDIFTSDGTEEIREILGGSAFIFPKPSLLIRDLVDQVTGAEDIVLDSFAGSGTTGHAVLRLNKEDGSSRRFILIQMPTTRRTMRGKDSTSARRLRPSACSG